MLSRPKSLQTFSNGFKLVMGVPDPWVWVKASERMLPQHLVVGDLPPSSTDAGSERERASWKVAEDGMHGSSVQHVDRAIAMLRTAWQVDRLHLIILLCQLRPCIELRYHRNLVSTARAISQHATLETIKRF